MKYLDKRPIEYFPSLPISPFTELFDTQNLLTNKSLIYFCHRLKKIMLKLSEKQIRNNIDYVTNELYNHSTLNYKIHDVFIVEFNENNTKKLIFIEKDWVILENTPLYIYIQDFILKKYG